jgi:hypothetical protein
MPPFSGRFFSWPGNYSHRRPMQDTRPRATNTTDALLTCSHCSGHPPVSRLRTGEQLTRSWRIAKPRGRVRGDTARHPARSPESSGEQTSSDPRFNQVLAKGTPMSEQPTNYMSELDQWTEQTIIAPLADAYTHGPEEVIVRARQLAMRSIRERGFGKATGTGKTRVLEPSSALTGVVSPNRRKF